MFFGMPRYRVKGADVASVLVFVSLLSVGQVFAQTSVPDGARQQTQLSRNGVSVYQLDNTLWLSPSELALQQKQVVIPRLCAPIRSFRWKDDLEAELKFLPEPGEWLFSWNELPKGAPIIEVVFDRAPVLLADCLPAVPAGDSSIMLHAFEASTFGEKLRFEPQWFKNTVGYWAVGTDYATWTLTVDQPGTYSVAVLQGCGKDQGGSDAVITLRQGDKVKADLRFQTIDTGHFQNFRWNHLGVVDLAQAGEYELRIDATRIAKAALFDVRAIHLVKQAKSPE
jgi:hypothetical protein